MTALQGYLVSQYHVVNNGTTSVEADCQVSKVHKALGDDIRQFCYQLSVEDRLHIDLT
jgi:hypothetical protein